MNKQFKLKSKLADWYHLSIPERNRLNNEVLDEKLIKWPRMVKRAKKKPLPGLAGFHVVFFHIPKTGGTTLDYITAKNYRIDYVYQVNAPAFDKHISGIFKNEQMFRTIMGHYELNDYFYQLFDRLKVAQFTMLREPVARVISYYDYVRTSENHPKYELAKDMTLDEFIVHDAIDEMPNAQAHRILGTIKEHNWKKDPRNFDELLEAAKYQLEHRFSLFGLTELYDEFLIMAQRTLGWQDIFYRRMNESKVKTDKSTISAETINTIKEVNALDVALYDFAKKLFNRRCQQLGIDNARVKKFKQHNKQYDQLLNWHIE